MPSEKIQSRGHYEEDEENIFDIKKIVFSFFYHWHWYLLSVICVLLIAFLYLRYSTAEYRVDATILVQDDQKGADLPNSDIIKQLGLTGKSNVDNEVEVLESRTLMERVVNELQLYIEYFEEGRVKSVEIFEKAPIHLFAIRINEDLIRNESEYYFILNSTGGYDLFNNDNEIIKFSSDTLKLVEGDFLISIDSSKLKYNPKRIIIKIRKPENVSSQLLKNFNVSVPNKQVTTIRLSLSTNIPQKGERILNTLINVYLRTNVEDKNRIADSTMKFIDDRVEIIGQELSDIDKDIQQFKEVNNLTDISAQSQALIESNTNNLQQLSNQLVQIEIIQSLQEFLENNANNKSLVPVSLVVNDPGFLEQLTNYNQLQVQRERLLLSSTENNPIIINIDERLSIFRKNLVNSLSVIRKGLESGINELKKQTNQIGYKTKAVPEKERIFLEKSRMQTVKQQLFLFLLQKREETALSKSSTLANARIIDSAKSEKFPFKPRVTMIYFSVFLIGLLFPSLLIYGKNILDNSVKNKDHILKKLNIPVVGEISHYNGNLLIPIKQGSRTILSEHFRILRTNMQYVLAGVEKPVILFTSSMSSEGKSFLSLNTAFSMAMAGKKTLYIELDLRKPRLANRLKLDPNQGFSNYIIGHVPLEKIIHPSGFDSNFWVIHSGPMPPNPAELLLLPKSQSIFDELRKQFDVIIIDTPPVGLVVDPMLLFNNVDSVVFVVRQGKTQLQQLKQINEMLNNQEVPRPVSVLNDVKVDWRGKYGYGYGYAYFEDERKWDKLKRKYFSKKKND